MIRKLEEIELLTEKANPVKTVTLQASARETEPLAVAAMSWARTAVLIAAMCTLLPSAKVCAQVPEALAAPKALGPAVVPGFEPAAADIALSLSKARLFELRVPVRDVIVANPEIADVIIRSPTQAYIVAKKLGETNIFFAGPDGKIVLNLRIRVIVELDGARQAMKALLPNANIEVQGVKGTIVLSGVVRSAKDSADAAAIARRFVEKDADIINMLRIIADQQVLLKMRIAEIQRNALRTLGATTSFARTRGGRTFTLDTTGAGAGIAATTFGTIFIPIQKLGFRTTTFSALEKRGLVKTLAEPALVAMSGETANFLAGGEFPVVTGVDSNNNPLIGFKKFGVALSFTPVVLANNQISLRIKTEVSRTSTENEVVVAGVTVKGLTVRRADSTVTLNSGGSLMIAGLIQNDEFNQFDGVPWLKDLPILGALFRSHSFQQDESELIILVTAFLVHPVKPSLALSLPTDGFVPASDTDIYLLGQLYKRYSRKKTPPEVHMLKGPIGYIME